MASLNIMARGHGCLGVETFLLVNKQVNNCKHFRQDKFNWFNVCRAHVSLIALKLTLTLTLNKCLKFSSNKGYFIMKKNP